MTMFIVLTMCRARHSHGESSLGSCNEYRRAPSGPN